MGTPIMVQGTASHVGKSVIVAGLCRLLRQEGLTVAPFKAQNMALNSFVTPDGLEIGRAQAVQAEACGISPAVEMNPILLKPEGNARSQVVVMGRAYSTMDAWEYHRRTEELWPIVEASLRSLLDHYDVVVIEGAGSPAEVNLRHSDIVNMRVAEVVSAPVVLVADIDRGGVFASLVGTMELLEPAHRDLVAGFVVNKFRGDSSLFEPGVRFLEERLCRPVLGVVPWIEELGLAEEDSLGIPPSVTDVDDGDVDVAVLRLPHIANFDDVDALRATPGVVVRFVERMSDFGAPDLVILPGTKTTRADLAWLRQQGLVDAITSHVDRGGAVLGICGGYQMLGERIEDPDGVEGAPGCVDGLGFLPCTTWYEPVKATMQVEGTIRADRGPIAAAQGHGIRGYEIHMGRTESRADALIELGEGAAARSDGAISADGAIAGTYVHGLLGNEVVTSSLVAWLAARRGIPLRLRLAREDPYERLAAVLRQSLRVGHIRELITPH